jgi:hypothetical protein
VSVLFFPFSTVCVGVGNGVDKGRPADRREAQGAIRVQLVLQAQEAYPRAHHPYVLESDGPELHEEAGQVQGKLPNHSSITMMSSLDSITKAVSYSLHKLKGIKLQVSRSCY